MRVFTNYSDGCTWLTISGDATYGTYTEIALWQWWLYSLFLGLDSKVHHWVNKLDNRAIEERDSRTVKEANE